VFRGLFDSNINSGAEYDTQPLAALFSMEPWSKPKTNGPAFIPSTYCEHDAREHTAQRERGSFVALTGDIDSGDHQLEAVFDAVEAFAGTSAWLIYSSPHARPGDMRWRIIMPLAEPQPFAAWYDAQQAFFAFMEARGLTMDHALARAAQPVFLPNVPSEHTKSGTPLRGEYGAPLHYVTLSSGIEAPGLPLEAGPAGDGIAALHRQRLENERLREHIRREAEAKRANKSHGDGASLMEDFNAANSVATMLELCGYQQSPQNAEDWRSPHQTGETYATRVVGSKWISLSQSDVSAGVGTTFKEGCFGDAYDLYVHYKHGGDHKSAYRALGQEKRAENVVYLHQPEPPSWMSEAPGYDEMPEWMNAEPQVEAEAAEQAANKDMPLPKLPGIADLADWSNSKAPDRDFVISGWIIRGACGLLSGQEGVGKSLLAQQMATCAALGLTFLGLEIARTPAVYITCEDPVDELWRRQEDVNRSLGITMADLAGKLMLVSLKGHLGNELAVFDAQGRISVTERYQQIEGTVKAFGAGLIFLDNAAHFFTGNENARHDVATFLGLLERLSEIVNGAVILLAHPNKQHAQGNKQGNEYSGSTGWSAHVRNRLFLDWAQKDAEGNYLGDDGRMLRKSKANYGKKGEEINFRWHDWSFVRDEDLPPSVAAELREVGRANFENDCFLACLRQRLSERRAVSELASSTYAPKVFANMPEARGCTKEHLTQAMDRLFRLKAIERGYLWVAKGEGKSVHGIREVGAELPTPTPMTSDDPPMTDFNGEA
jgi:RecA-family ATPase